MFCPPAPAGWHTGTRDQQQVVVHEVVATQEVICKTVVCPKDVPLSLVDMVENPTRTNEYGKHPFLAWTPCACRCVDEIMTASSLKSRQSWCIPLFRRFKNMPLRYQPHRCTIALWTCQQQKRHPWHGCGYAVLWLGNDAWLKYLRCFLQIGPSGMLGPMLCQWLVWLIFSTAASVFVLLCGSSMWFALLGGGVLPEKSCWRLTTLRSSSGTINYRIALSHPWQSLVQTCWNFLAGGC